MTHPAIDLQISLNGHVLMQASSDHLHHLGRLSGLSEPDAARWVPLIHYSGLVVVHRPVTLGNHVADDQADEPVVATVAGPRSPHGQCWYDAKGRAWCVDGDATRVTRVHPRATTQGLSWNELVAGYGPVTLDPACTRPPGGTTVPPSAGDLFLDRDSDVWRALEEGSGYERHMKCLSALRGSTYSWEQLIDRFGPVRLLIPVDL